MKLAELLSSEVADLPRDTVVIVPVASLEQHSLHLPVFTDSLILEECIRRLENRLSDTVLVLPVMWLGYSQHHMPYPGTVSASSDTHQNLMQDIITSMISHGFRTILIVNSHGGNEANIAVLLQRLMERHEEVAVYATTPYAGPARKKMDAILEAGPKGSGHAGETETSMMLHLRPDLVNTDRLDLDGQSAFPLPGVKSYRKFNSRTAHGGIGDPRSATAEKGERLFQVAEDNLVEIVRQIREGEIYET